MYLQEKNIIYILNCINITLYFLKNHTYEEKKLLSCYFNYDNYYLYYNDLLELHRYISLYENRRLYNTVDEIFFKGQEEYLTSHDKDFSFLKNKKLVSNNKMFNINFLKIFKKGIDKESNIV